MTWRKRTIMELAEQSKLFQKTNYEFGVWNPDYLGAFAALVIANNPPQSFMTWQDGYEAGKQAERERIKEENQRCYVARGQA